VGGRASPIASMLLFQSGSVSFCLTLLPNSLTNHSTVDGPNDQANLEAIYTVGPILQKMKPRVATLEQTFGLLTHEEHKKIFLMLLHDIGKAGYDVRYKIQDLSQYGLVQKRKRLLIIAARYVSSTTISS
jgi:site-specific DNA-cytosine methylase